MWKVTWNWIGNEYSIGEKTFEKNDKAQSFVYLLMANSAVNEAKVEKV